MFEVEDFVRLMVGEAMRGEATARAVGVDLFASFESSIEDWVKNNRPDLNEGPGAAAVARLLSAMVVGIFIQHAADVLGEEGDDLTALSLDRAREAASILRRRTDLPARPERTLAPCPTPPPPPRRPPSPPPSSRRRPRPCGPTASTSPTCRATTPTSAASARVADGAGDGAAACTGPGARYTFGLADPRRPGVHAADRAVDVEAVSPTLVSAAMSGGSDAYEEFVVRPLDGGGCEATLTLWVTLPDGLSEEVRAAAAAGSLALHQQGAPPHEAEVLDGG